LLRYFRINDPYRLLGLLVLLALLWLPLFIDAPPITLPELKSMVLGEKVAEGRMLYTDIIDSTPPLASWFYGLCDILLGRNLTARHIAAFLILFLQSFFFGSVLLNKKVFAENTYIPTLLFSLLTLLSFDMLSLTADLAAFGFLLLAINALLTQIEFRVQRDEAIFNIGLYISLAMLFRFSYGIYLPGFMLILILYTRSSIRKYLLLLTGFGLPHLVFVGVYYLDGNVEALWSRFYLANLFTGPFHLISLKSLLVLSGVPALYLVIVFFALNRGGRLTNYQSQVLQAMFLLFVVALVQVFFTSDLRPQSLLPVMLPVSFFMTHYLLLIRRRKFAELNTWIFMLGIVGMMYLARYQKIAAVDYSRLLAGASSLEFLNKRVLVLDEDPQAYVDNIIAPAFIDWRLAKEFFDQPDYYDHVLLINRLFMKDPPEVIIDPENRMEKFFERIPRLKAQYKKSAQGRWEIVKN
jgi:hypothetical protein